MGQRLAHLVMHMTQVAHYRDINNPYLPLFNSRCCKTAIDKWHKETNLFIIIALRIVLACVVAYTEYVDIITEYTDMHWVLLGTVPVPGGGSEFWEFRRTAWRQTRSTFVRQAALLNSQLSPELWPLLFMRHEKIYCNGHSLLCSHE